HRVRCSFGAPASWKWQFAGLASRLLWVDVRADGWAENFLYRAVCRIIPQLQYEPARKPICWSTLTTTGWARTPGSGLNALSVAGSGRSCRLDHLFLLAFRRAQYRFIRSL